MQIAAVSTWQMMRIYIYMGVSVYWSLSVLVILVYMCVKYISKRAGTKVPRLNIDP